MPREKKGDYGDERLFYVQTVNYDESLINWPMLSSLVNIKG